MLNQHVVKRGETLWGIANLHYGDPRKWPVIAAHNNLPDADRIFVGQILKLPPRSSAMSNGSRPGQSPWNGTSSSASKTSSEPDLIELLGMNPSAAVCTPDDLYYKSTLPQRSYGATTMSSEPVLMQRGMNSAIESARPPCGIEFSKEETLFSWQQIVLAGNIVVQIDVSLFGQAVVEVDGVAKCKLDGEGVKAEAEAVVKDGVKEVFSVSADLKFWETGQAVSLSVTFVGANNGQNVTYECSLKGEDIAKLKLVFEASPQPVEFKFGHSKISGNIGIRLEVTGVTLLRLREALPKQSHLRVAIPAGLLMFAYHAKITAWIIAAGKTLGFGATAGAGATLAVPLALVLVLVGAASLVGREYEVQL